MITMSRRRALPALARGIAVAGDAGAQAHASLPIKVIVGFAPEAAVDVIARALGAQLGTLREAHSR